MPTIYDRSKPGDVDKVLSLSGDEIARTIAVQSNWRHLRVGMLYEISRSGTSATPTFGFGLSAGSSSLFGDASTNHFVGITNTVGTTTTLNGGYNPPTWTNGTVQIAQKTGSNVVAKTGGLTWENPSISDSSSMWRVLLLVDFLRPTTDPGIMTVRSYTSHAGGFTWASSGAENTQAQFDTYMTQITASTPWLDKTTAQFAVSESVHGVLDTINIYWSPATPPLEISKVSVYRFS